MKVFPNIDSLLYDTCRMCSCYLGKLSLQINVMTNRDMLLDFSRVVEVFKAENDICAVPTLLPLNSVLSVDLLEWFGKFFRFQAHKTWLESVCHIQIQRQSNGVKSLQISENSFVHMANVALLTGLDDVYMHRPVHRLYGCTSRPAFVATWACQLRSHCVGFRLRLRPGLQPGMC